MLRAETQIQYLANYSSFSAFPNYLLFSQSLRNRETERNTILQETRQSGVDRCTSVKHEANIGSYGLQNQRNIQNNPKNLVKP